MAHRHLLHVDDSEDDLFLFRRAFEKAGFESWILKSAEGGKAALEYFNAVKDGTTPKPDLALIDLKMPIVTGFDILDWLRKNDLALPVAILSSSELKADQEKALELGARAYVSKRDTLTDVVEFVRGWGG